MLAQHLHDKPALCPIRLVLDAHIAAVNRAFASTSIVISAFEDGLECSIVQLTGKVIASAGAAVGVEIVADEERARIERKRGVCSLG